MGSAKNGGGLAYGARSVQNWYTPSSRMFMTPSLTFEFVENMHREILWAYDKFQEIPPSLPPQNKPLSVGNIFFQGSSNTTSVVSAVVILEGSHSLR